MERRGPAKVEDEAIGLENKLLENYEFKKSMLPTRNWGQPFDASKYLANNSELIGTFGSITAAATQHYVNNGYGEGRTF